VDCAGNLTVSDTFNYRVRQVDAETGVIETIAGNGRSGYDGDGGLAIQATLGGQRGLAFGKDGSPYVADRLKIRKISGLPGKHSGIAGMIAATTRIKAVGPGTNGPEGSGLASYLAVAS